MDYKNIQLANYVNNRNPKTVLTFVKDIFLTYYPKKSFKDIVSIHKQIIKLFNGKLPGYKACNTEYHNLQHTMETFAASAVLIDGYNLVRKELPLKTAKNVLIAALLHDTGYIQEEWDNGGTGAKHSESHVGRSIALLVKLNNKLNIPQEDISSISNMIRCIEPGVKFKCIPFSAEEEKTAGCILGSADIMGQMADREYLERLLFLYNEFKEAGIPGYNTEFDMIINTLDYYETIVKRLTNTLGSVYEYAEHYFRERAGLNINLYMESIRRNITYIETIIEDDTTNFRQKLKRGDQEVIQKEREAAIIN